VAEVLSQQTEDFAYANLAVRGKLVKQIIDEQVEPALLLRPDLVTISAGGNDVIRPGTDPDEIARLLDSAVERLRSEDATVVIFTGADVGFSPVFRNIRGKVAIYNENLRAIAGRRRHVVAHGSARRTDVGTRPTPPELTRPPHGHAHGACGPQR
jgi:lysophospholipase L1-like esterase